MQQLKKQTFLVFFLTVLMFLTSLPVAFAANHAESFTDVQTANVHHESILALNEQGVISGYPDGSFGVDQQLERQHAAALIYRLLELDVPSDMGDSLDRYQDIDTNHPYALEIAATTKVGVFEGDPSGLFNPEGLMTREQTASVLSRAFELPEAISSDVDVQLENVRDVHKEDVRRLAQFGLTKELDDFRPVEPVTRGQFASFTFRSQHVDRMSVIHTNDLHGRVDQYPQMITAVNDARLTRPHNLLLDAGDIFSGTLYFNEFKGQAALHFMNMMDYDAFSFGNHEFDLADASADVVHKDLVAFIDNADFPFVASNLDFSQHQEFDTYTTDKTDLTTNPEDSMIYDGMIKEMNGEKVGIFGLSTEDIANISSPVDVTFSDAFTRAEEMVAQFEAAGVDRIVALTHLGYNSDPSVGNDLTLAEAVEGIDIIVGGHSHDFLAEPTIVMNESTNEPTVIVQAGQYGEAVGTLDVIFNDDGVITAVKGALVDVNEQVPNKLAEEALTPFTEAVEELALEPAGFSLMEQLANPRLSSGDDSSVRANETALGNMIADGFLRAGKKADANTLIAFQNGGGVRAPLPESLEGDGPYEITVGDLITVQPFGNRLTLVDLTGEEILTALETSVKDAPEEKRPLKK